MENKKIISKKKFPGRPEKPGLEASYPGRSPHITQQHLSDGLGSLQLPPTTPAAALENKGSCLQFFMSLVSVPKFERRYLIGLGHMPVAWLQGWLKMQIHSSSHFHCRQWDVQGRKDSFRAKGPKTMVSRHKNQTNFSVMTFEMYEMFNSIYLKHH